MALDIVAWHDRTTTDHQAQVNTAAAIGFRTLALSIYGDRHDPRYASVMIRRASLVGERQFVNLDAAQFQALFNQQAAQGWGPEILACTGPTSDPLFSVSFIEGPIPFTRFGLTLADFNAQNVAQMAAGNILRWADVYGDPGNLRYVGIWIKNPDGRTWNADGVNDPMPIMQQRFNALVSGFARPVVMAMTPEMNALMVYDDSLGGQWQAHVGLTSADYQAKFNALVAQGLRPIRVNAKGSGSGARFCALFADREDTDARTLRMTGSPAVPTLDAAMKDVIATNMLRGASLAVVQGTRLVYARGYTFAEPGYPDVQPTTLFRQASVSKLFTAAAIYQLIDEGAKLANGATFTLDTLLQDALPGIANGTAVANWNLVTVRHLLEMTSGIVSDVMLSDPQVSQFLPITALQMGQWLYRQKLNNTPGDLTQGIYSNAGYMLLGLIVAHLRNAATFIDGLKPMLNKLQMTRVRASATLPASQAADEARYHSRPPTTSRSVMVTFTPLCAQAYGESNLENLGGGGGLSAAAVDVARLVAALNVTDNNPLMNQTTLQQWLTNAAWATAHITGPVFAHGFHGFDALRPQGTSTTMFEGEKGGELSTSQNGVRFTMGGISTVICWNGKTPKPPVWFPNFDVLTNAINGHDWAGIDLFPSFGMTAFPVPLLHLPPRLPGPLR